MAISSFPLTAICTACARHRLQVTTVPAVTVLCYTALRELEQKNIVHIIEGVRYGRHRQPQRCWCRKRGDAFMAVEKMKS